MIDAGYECMREFTTVITKLTNRYKIHKDFVDDISDFAGVCSDYIGTV